MNADDDRSRMDGERDGASEGGRIDARLKSLREKLDAEKRREEERRGQARADNSGMAQALRLGSEFVAGVVVGFAIGYGLDHLLGTTPWGMIVFLLLGFAAGTLNVMRAAGVVAEPDPRRLRRTPSTDTETADPPSAGPNERDERP